MGCECACVCACVGAAAPGRARACLAEIEMHGGRHRMRMWAGHVRTARNQLHPAIATSPPAKLQAHTTARHNVADREQAGGEQRRKLNVQSASSEHA